MKGNFVKDVLRFNTLKIRNKSLINQLSKDELIYCHLHCCTNDEFIDELGGFNLPLSMEDYETVKRNINLKKVKINKIREDLLNFIESDESTNSTEWYDISVFENKGLSDGNIFYVLLFSLMSKQLTEVFKGFDKGKIAKFLAEVSSYTDDKKPEYYAIKSLTAMVVLDRLNNLADSDEIIECMGGDKEIVKELSDDVKNEIVNIQKTLVVCLYNNYTMCCKETIESMSKEYQKFKNDIKKSNLQIEERNNKIKELKENIRDLNKQLKDCQKVLELAEIKESIKTIESSLKNIEKSNSNVSDEIKNVKKSIVSTSYENQINNYITRVTDLKKELFTKSLELKELKKDFEFYKANIEDNFIEHIKNNGVSAKVLTFLKSLPSETLDLMVSEIDSKDTEDIIPHKEEVPEKEEVIPIFNGIGYVSIEDNIHYVNFANGSRVQITELNDKIFLSEGQFIIVDEEFRLSKTTTSKYEDNGKSIAGLKLGVVESIEPLIIRANDEIIREVKFNGNKGYYKLNQVIALNDDNYIVRAFRTIRFNADETIKSIKSKGITAYFVLDVFSNAFFKLRNIETGVEDIYNLDTNGVDISRLSIVFVKDLVVVSATAQSKFYTASSLYKDRVVYGPIQIENGIAKITKQSGEISIVNNIPESYIIESGDVIAVDEFNNFLYISSTDDLYLEKSILRKTAKQIVNGKDNSKPIETKGEITIIGNLFYKNSYTMSFFKIGYKINMLHGYDTSINKIIQTAKDSEAIIVNTSYCSHDNFWQIKDEVKDGALSHLKYIFTQEDGANMLVHKFNELKSQDEVAITQ